MISSPVPGAAKLPVILGVLGAVNAIGVLGTETEASKVGTSSSILAPEDENKIKFYRLGSYGSSTRVSEVKKWVLK